MRVPGFLRILFGGFAATLVLSLAAAPLAGAEPIEDGYEFTDEEVGSVWDDDSFEDGDEFVDYEGDAVWEGGARTSIDDVDGGSGDGDDRYGTSNDDEASDDWGDWSDWGDGSAGGEDVESAGGIPASAVPEPHYCAEELPRDWKRECKARNVAVPDTFGEFRSTFRDWVADCVSRSRVEQHMGENEARIESLWDRVQGLSSVRIGAKVESMPLADGCVGVASLRFELEVSGGGETQSSVPPPAPAPSQRDHDSISEGFGEVVRSQDPDRLDEAVRDSADCFSFETRVADAWVDMVKKALLALPLSKLEGRYACLYGAFTAGYPLGVAAALVDIPEHEVRNRLMIPQTGLGGGYFDCNAVSRDAANLAMLSAYRRVRSLGASSRQAQRERVEAYLEAHREQARRSAYPEEVYRMAWAAKRVYGVDQPRNPISPTEVGECLEDAIEDAAQSQADARLRDAR